MSAVLIARLAFSPKIWMRSSSWLQISILWCNMTSWITFLLPPFRSVETKWGSSKILLETQEAGAVRGEESFLRFFVGQGFHTTKDCPDCMVAYLTTSHGYSANACDLNERTLQECIRSLQALQSDFREESCWLWVSSPADMFYLWRPIVLATIQLARMLGKRGVIMTILMLRTTDESRVNKGFLAKHMTFASERYQKICDFPEIIVQSLSCIANHWF